MKELEALVHLCCTPGLTPAKIKALIKNCGSALAAWDQKKSLAGEKELLLAERHGITIISYTDPRYPKRLLEISDFPLILYVKGHLEKGDQRSLAVIGTRFMTTYGSELAEKMGYSLAAQGFTVVSGLAKGIDTMAHAGALRHQKGRTIAVLGSGLCDLYPRENIPLAEQIEQKGALISEFPLMTPPDRQNFPRRNRIVSGMTLGTVLIEAPLKSGAMLTAQNALDQGRRLFAFPGRVDVETFQGNHKLIKAGKAKLVENEQDIVENFEDLFHYFAPEYEKTSYHKIESSVNGCKSRVGAINGKI